MIVVIAGSRGVLDYSEIEQAVAESGFEITEVVSGGAAGADRLGERWAREHDVKLTRMIPDWDGQGKRAGFLRNADMADYAKANCQQGGALIALWMGKSRGTGHMIDLARERGLSVFVRDVEVEAPRKPPARTGIIRVGRG